MNALIGPPKTGKAKKIISLITKTYCMIDDNCSSTVHFENIRLQWRQDLNPKSQRDVENYNLINTAGRGQMPKVLLPTPTNKVVDVLEELLQHGRLSTTT